MAGAIEVVDKLLQGRPVLAGDVPPQLLAEMCAASLHYLNNGTAVQREAAHAFYQWWQKAALTVDAPQREPDVSGGTRDKKLDIWLERDSVVTSERVGGENFIFVRINPGAQIRDAGGFAALVTGRWESPRADAGWSARIRRDLEAAYGIARDGLR